MGRQNGSKNWKDMIELPILVFAGDEVKGSWIETNCSICSGKLAYWSKDSKPLAKHKFPLCERCK